MALSLRLRVPAESLHKQLDSVHTEPQYRSQEECFLRLVAREMPVVLEDRVLGGFYHSIGNNGFLNGMSCDTQERLYLATISGISFIATS